MLRVYANSLSNEFEDRLPVPTIKSRAKYNRIQISAIKLIVN